MLCYNLKCQRCCAIYQLLVISYWQTMSEVEVLLVIGYQLFM